MKEALADQIDRIIGQVAELYHRLVLVVAPAGAGKTTALQQLQKKLGAPLINVNLELSRRLLDLTEQQRALKLQRLLHDIVRACEGDTILLDNVEILFDVSLQQDPLRLFQGLSRNKTIVVAWNGSAESGYVRYAAPGHPEYKRYPIQDFLIASPELTPATKSE